MFLFPCQNPTLVSECVHFLTEASTIIQEDFNSGYRDFIRYTQILILYGTPQELSVNDYSPYLRYLGSALLHMQFVDIGIDKESLELTELEAEEIVVCSEYVRRFFCLNKLNLEEETTLVVLVAIALVGLHLGYVY